MFKIKEIKDQVVFDTETTGLDLQNDLIIEYGLLRIRDNKPVDSLRLLVKRDMEIPPEAFKAHGISRETLMKEGMEPRLACQMAREFMGNDIVNGLNNVAYDFPMLENECNRYFIQRPKIENWIDTGMLHKGVHIGNIWNEREMFYKYSNRVKEIRAKGVKYNMDFLAKTYEVNNLRVEGLHGAMEDVTMTFHIFNKFKEKHYVN